MPLRGKRENRFAAQEKYYADPIKHRNAHILTCQIYNVVKLFYVTLHTGAQLQSIGQHENVSIPFALDTKSNICGVAS